MPSRTRLTNGIAEFGMEGDVDFTIVDNLLIEDLYFCKRVRSGSSYRMPAAVRRSFNSELILVYFERSKSREEGGHLVWRDVEGIGGGVGVWWDLCERRKDVGYRLTVNWGG